MQLTRAIELLVLGLSAMTVAEATFVDINVVGRAVNGIQQRQNDENAKTDAGATTTPPPKTTPTATEQTSSTTTLTSSSTSTKLPPTTTSSSSTSSSSSSETDHTSSSTSSSASPTEPPESTTKPQSPSSTEAQMITTIVTKTLADGSQVTLTSETPNPTPGLANNNSSGQSSGMSTQTRNTVIGVVVGVGGAIILGGLALVAWRIWGRKKHQDENDGLMDYGSTVEKPETVGSMTGRTPFQSTLESYHAPTQVNTAANF